MRLNIRGTGDAQPVSERVSRRQGLFKSLPFLFKGIIFEYNTPDDKKKIKERMKEAGIKNMSAYIRKMAIDGYIVRLDLSDVNEVARLLHINSNNLNQYAKQANTNGSIYYGDIQNLKRQHEELCGLLKAIYQRLLSI